MAWYLEARDKTVTGGVMAEGKGDPLRSQRMFINPTEVALPAPGP